METISSSEVRSPIVAPMISVDKFSTIWSAWVLQSIGKLQILSQLCARVVSMMRKLQRIESGHRWCVRTIPKKKQ